MRTAEITLWVLEALTVLAILRVALRRPRRLADLLLAALVLAAAIVWFVDNTPIEGHVLWTITAGNGVTVADMAGLPGVIVGIVLGYRAWRTPRQVFGPPLRAYGPGRIRGL